MKKTDMIFRLMGTLLIAGAALVSCSKDAGNKLSPKEAASEKEAGSSQELVEGGFFTLTVEAGFDTKALSDPGDGTLTVTWEVGDSVTVFNRTTGKPIEGKLYAQSEGASTQLVGPKLQGNISQGDSLFLEFGTPNNFEVQDGTLTGAQTSIDKNSDYANATIEVTDIQPAQGGEEGVSGNIITTAADFARHQAIVKLTLKDRKATPEPVKADSLVIFKGKDLVKENRIATVEPIAATDELYVALPKYTSKDTITFYARGENGFMYKLKHEFNTTETTVGFKEGEFYTRTLQMKKLMLIARDSLKVSERVYTSKEQHLLDPAKAYLYWEINKQRVFVDDELDKFDKKCQILYAVLKQEGDLTPSVEQIQDEDWKTTAKATHAGTYAIFYKAIGNYDFEDVEVDKQPIIVTIQKATPQFKVSKDSTMTYNTAARVLADTASVYILNGLEKIYIKNLKDIKDNKCSIKYAVDTVTAAVPADNSSKWKTTLTDEMCKRTHAGSYKVWVKVFGNEDIANTLGGSSTAVINKANLTYTGPTKASGLTYNGSSQSLITESTPKIGNVSITSSIKDAAGKAISRQYKVGSESWKTTCTQINAGTYAVIYKIVGNGDINDFNATSLGNVTISPKVVAPTITLDTSTYTYDGNAKTPTPTVKDGSTTINANEYNVSYSNNTNAGTATVTISDKTGGNYTVSGITTFTINKANGWVELSQTSVPMSAPEIRTVTFTTHGGSVTNEVSGENWSTYYAYAVSGNTIQVYRKAGGSATHNMYIKIKCAETTNYKAAEATCLFY